VSERRSAVQPPEVRKLVAQDFAGAPAGKGVAVTSEVHYAVEGVPSEYDRLVVVVVELAGGGYGTFVSSRPDNTPRATLAVLNASLDTLTAQ